jgi:hypothetical protein
MALQASGTITLAQIQAEFGGANPIYLSEYYRGGAYVPNTTANLAVPTSGAIDLADFYGTSNLISQAFTLTAGYQPAGKISPELWGFASGVFLTSNIGSVSPASFQGNAIRQVTTPSSAYLSFALLGNLVGTAPFEHININGATLYRTASITPDGAIDPLSTETMTRWVWSSGANTLANGGTYTLTITK